MRALIVDDSRYIRGFLRALLEEYGAECSEAENGEIALAALREGNGWDIAFVDVNMPVMGGLDCVRAIRSDQKMDSLRIMMVTTEADHFFIEAALEAGADEYLMKPFDAAALAEKLQIIGMA
ncbi:MAG TPA: response regulator [Alloacidobacterium sp.]|nr:response regulator [Alloacidobacterium sp.]